MKRVCIDRSTIRFKIHFVLWAGGQATVTPCIAVIAKNKLHLSPASFAALVLGHEFLLVLVKPTIGYIVDYFNKLKGVILTLTLLYMTFLCLLLISPPLPKENETSINEPRYKLQDVCKMPRNLNNATGVMLAFLNDLVVHNVKNDKNRACRVQFEHLINISKGNILHSKSDRTSKETEALPVVPFEICRELDYCGPMNQEIDFKDEICILCCENSEDCLKISKKDLLIRTSNNKEKVNDFQYYQFWVFVLIYVVLDTCASSIFTLTDTALCETVEQLGKDFGKERVWGALGWGLFAPVGGFLDDLTDDYLAATILCIVMMLFMLLNLSQMEMVKPHMSQNVLKDVGTVIKSRSFVYLFTASVVNGICYGIIWYYLIWHVTSIGGDRLICGLVHTIQCVAGEIPFMFCSGWIVRKIGYLHTITLALLAACVRFFWYSQVTNAWLILLSEWTHGITYGLFYTAMFTFSKANAIPGTEATTQAIMVSGYEGIGTGLGSVIFGVGFNYFGGHQTFFCCGAFFSLCAVLNIWYTICEKFKTRILIIQKDTFKTKC